MTFGPRTPEAPVSFGRYRPQHFARVEPVHPADVASSQAGRALSQAQSDGAGRFVVGAIAVSGGSAKGRALRCIPRTTR